MQKAPTFASAYKKTWLTCWLIAGMLVLSQPLFAWPWTWNRYDKKEQKTGRWRTFHDADEKVVHYQGRYRHGKEVGAWKTYTADGKLYFKEKIKRRQRSYETVYYHPNGKVSHRGMAYLRDAENGAVHFFWEGDWEYFDEQGQPLGIKTFVKGNPTTDTPVLSSSNKKIK
ncbi:toxin-antitoxin system YwqK family antitoxin [Rufibacter sediminis]|uniref:MORN repeat variant n=1 Tax=Rufibacter sediminis TaxID=2762756 RepID=A0ABR6VWY7_9BACT|nr:hypothetical protein [Rufibacter sediminis]MBC3541648.1 hypothetical protein [Rufibacter sediminis]